MTIQKGIRRVLLYSDHCLHHNYKWTVFTYSGLRMAIDMRAFEKRTQGEKSFWQSFANSYRELDLYLFAAWYHSRKLCVQWSTVTSWRKVSLMVPSCQEFKNHKTLVWLFITLSACTAKVAEYSTFFHSSIFVVALSFFWLQKSHNASKINISTN